MKSIMMSILGALLVPVGIFAQDSVKGNVRDNAGQPLPGAAVIVTHDGKQHGTVTDIDGNYTIDAVYGDEIEFNYIGFVPQKITVTSAVINITLSEDRQVLDDVVVVGYGTQKKVNLTGSVAAVSSEVLENRSTNSVSQMLQGAMPNVNISIPNGSPGKGGTIRIRGVGSINSSSPLVLIDGIPGDIDQISPDDVESISVLKDASSAAIYGARAAFGVVLVTTKEAEKGKANVSYNGYWSWSVPTVSTDFVTSGYEHSYIYDTSYIGRKGYMGAATGFTEADYEELKARQYDEVEDPSRPWIVETVENGRTKYHYYGNFDWWKYMYRSNMPSQSHSVNISGSNDKISYYISGSFYTKDGLIRIAEENYNRFTLNAKFSAQVYKWLKISNMTTFFSSVHSYPGGNSDNGAFARTNINGSPAYVPIGYDGNWTGLMASGKYLSENRFQDIAQGISKGQNKDRRFRNTFSLSITPLEGLSINADYTFGFTMEDNWKRQALVPVSNGYAGETTMSTSTDHKVDYINKNMTYDPSHVVNAYATYSKSINDTHNFSVTAGLNYEIQRYTDLLGYRTDVLSESLNALDLATGGVSVDDDGKIIGEIRAQGGGSAYELFGVFLRANYNYKERYLVEFNGRYDGSSRFLKGNRFGFFPSVSAGWRLSEEPFMDNIRHIINNAKLRASYGMLGNQLGVATYPYSTISQTQSSYIIDGSLAYYLTTPAPVSASYTWEKVATTDIGIDLALLQNRLSFSADWFIRNTSDMFVEGVTLPGVYGADPPDQNAGKMRTKGWEISLSWRDDFKLFGNVFNYEVFGSLGDARSFITEYQGNDTKLLSDYYEGMEIGEIWGFRTCGLFMSDEEASQWTSAIDQTYVMREIYEQSMGEWAVARGGDVKYLDIDGDKKITDGAKTLDDHGDMEIIGNSTPRYNFGFGLNLNYFGFDFGITFQGIGKCDIYPNKEMEKFWGPWGRVNAAFLPEGIANRAWSEDNKNGYFPQLERGGSAYQDRGQMTTVNDRYLQSVAYVRLKNLSFGYTLPQKWTQKIRIERLRIYVAGDNLWYWSPFRTKYIDPEQAMASNDGRIYPFSKTFTVGVNLNF